jgi:hypothetical protein
MDTRDHSQSSRTSGHHGHYRADIIVLNAIVDTTDIAVITAILILRKSMSSRAHSSYINDPAT